MVHCFYYNIRRGIRERGIAKKVPESLKTCKKVGVIGRLSERAEKQKTAVLLHTAVFRIGAILSVKY